MVLLIIISCLRSICPAGPLSSAGTKTKCCRLCELFLQVIDEEGENTYNKLCTRCCAAYCAKREALRGKGDKMAGCNFNCSACGIHSSSDDCDEMEKKMNKEMAQGHEEGRDIYGTMSAVIGAALGFVVAFLLFKLINVAITQVSPYIMIFLWVGMTIFFEIILGNIIKKHDARKAQEQGLKTGP